MPKYLVSAPRPDFNDDIVGVRFRDGAAVVDPAASSQERSALAYFQRAGYAMTELDETPAEAAEVEPVTEAEPFDPAAHPADEVIAHLADADADEKARILAAEQAAAKPRKTVIAAAGGTEQGDQS